MSRDEDYYPDLEFDNHMRVDRDELDDDEPSHDATSDDLDAAPWVDSDLAWVERNADHVNEANSADAFAPFEEVALREPVRQDEGKVDDEAVLLHHGYDPDLDMLDEFAKERVTHDAELDRRHLLAKGDRVGARDRLKADYSDTDPTGEKGSVLDDRKAAAVISHEISDEEWERKRKIAAKTRKARMALDRGD